MYIYYRYLLLTAFQPICIPESVEYAAGSILSMQELILFSAKLVLFSAKLAYAQQLEKWYATIGDQFAIPRNSFFHRSVRLGQVNFSLENFWP